MKEISISLWEVDAKEVALLPDKTKVLIYNTFYRDYKLYSADTLAHIIHSFKNNDKFFTFEEPNFRSRKKSQNKKA